MEKKIKKFAKEIETMKNELSYHLENTLKELGKNKKLDLIQKKNFMDILKGLETNLTPIDSNIEDLKEYYSRMVLDMKELKIRSTDHHPTEAEIDQLGKNIDIIISCRGETNQKLQPTHVGNMKSILKGFLAQCSGKKVIIYIHGYNVNRRTALLEADSLFQILRKDMPDYRFILFTWPGDAGLTKFDLARSFAQYSGELLYKVTRYLKEEYSVDDIGIIAHSLGSQVALRSADLMGKNESYRNILLLGPAIEENIMDKNTTKGKYWYPDALDHIKNLNIVYSKTDIILEVCFSLHELGTPLGSNISKYKFDPKIKIHDLTPASCQIKGVAVHSHLQYWETQEQIHFYKDLLFENIKK